MVDNNKARQRVGYQVGTTNCGNCHSANQAKWDEEQRGECKKFSVAPFTILRHGVCRHHSSFRDNQAKFE